ncbi:hypothetical protein [Rhizobium mayense]|uniref:Uncharacterized protein n=1 Tax=Rhizobium mayense TaxID=1312184 RepID=A0ABT7K381_9HYPH|nr:hypothetical protein [Rhizobium mayense]MDL2402956.1 hypothetical protein [Rhizobium mayense]
MVPKAQMTAPEAAIFLATLGNYSHVRRTQSLISLNGNYNFFVVRRLVASNCGLIADDGARRDRMPERLASQQRLSSVDSYRLRIALGESDQRLFDLKEYLPIRA